MLIYREQVKSLTLLGDVANDLGLLQDGAILVVISGAAILALGIMGCFAVYRNKEVCLRSIVSGDFIHDCENIYQLILISF